MMRCIVCGSSQLDPEGYKCALCGGAPGIRAEQCYIAEDTKAKLLEHTEELRAFGITLEEYRPIQKSFGDKASEVGLAIQIVEALRPGTLREIILYLRKIKIRHDEILRLRLDEPEVISKTLKRGSRKTAMKKNVSASGK
jgi:hypothetical protein